MARLSMKKKDRGDAESSEAASSSQAATSGKKGARALRANERLRSVIKESTFGAGVEALDRNVRFRLLSDEDGNSRWLALLFQADAIGGLSEKTKRDEAKGSLVQQITSDHVETIATGEMLDREFMAIVPSAATLDRLGEYTMMVAAQYHWVVFSSANGELTFDQNIGPATYADAVAIQAGSPISSVVTDAPTLSRIESGGAIEDTPATVEAAGDEDPLFDQAARTDSEQITQTHVSPKVAPATAPEPEPTISAEPAGYSSEDDGPGVEFYENFDSAEEGDDDDDDQPFEVDVAVDSEDDADGEPDKDPYTAYLDVNASREFTEPEVRESIARRFMADDLDLVVDLNEFNSVFGHGVASQVGVSDVTPVDGSDWLGAQLSQMAQAANSELAAQRERNDAELRQLYVEYTSHHIEEVVKQVSLTDPESRFGKMMGLADKDRGSSVRNQHSTVTARRQGVERRFTDEADKAAEAAAAQARATHMQMNRGRRDAAVTQVDREVTQDIEARYENERQQVLRLRRADADLGMQQGKTLIFEEVSKSRLLQAEAEHELLLDWNKRILVVVDENRKSDIARAEALTESLSRTNSVEEERKVNALRMDEVRSDYADRVADFERRSLQMREDMVAQLAKTDAAWQEKLGVSEERVAQANHLSTELQRQLESVSTSIRSDYESRMASTEAARDAYALEVERAGRTASRTQRAVLLMMAILTVTALAVGVLVGWVTAQKSGTPVDVEATATAISSVTGWLTAI